MKSKPDLDYIYPVIDCPLCGATDVPVGNLYLEQDGLPKVIKYCLSCHQEIKEIPTPKGYMSMIELEETEWSYEL